MQRVQELIEAARANDRDKALSLIERDPSLVNARNPAGESAVLAGMYAGAWNVLGVLLSRGATLDLFGAAATGNTVILPALLDENPELVQAFAHDGWTALHLAAFFGHVEAARLLIDHGADVQARSDNATGNLPIHAAAVRGHLDVVRLLLSSGSEVDDRAAGGWTPLHLAADGGHLATVEVLLGAGANALATSESGETPLARASLKGHEAVAALLRQRQAKQ